MEERNAFKLKNRFPRPLENLVEKRRRWLTRWHICNGEAPLNKALVKSVKTSVSFDCVPKCKRFEERLDDRVGRVVEMSGVGKNLDASFRGIRFHVMDLKSQKLDFRS